MTIDTEVFGLIVAMLVQAGTFIWWASRLTARVEHLEEFRRLNTADSVPERLAKVEQALHDLRNTVQRLQPVVAAE